MDAKARDMLRHDTQVQLVKIPTQVQAQPQTVVQLFPVYLVMVAKSISNLDLSRGEVTFNFTLVAYVVPPKETPQHIRDAIAARMQVRVDDQPGISMGTAIIDRWKMNDLSWTLRSQQTHSIPIPQQARAAGHFPFDRFEVQFRFEFDSIYVPPVAEDADGKQIKVRFVVHKPTDINFGFHRGRRPYLSLDRLPEFKLNFKGRKVWGDDKESDKSQPVVIYTMEVIRNPANVIWTMILPMMATQGLLVLLHVNDEPISIGDMATIALAMFAFLTSIRSKIPDIPVLSVLDKFLVVFVLQLALVFVSYLARAWSYDEIPRNIFFSISAVGFLLQMGYIAVKWAISSVRIKRGHNARAEPALDTRFKEYKADEWDEPPTNPEDVVVKKKGKKVD